MLLPALIQSALLAHLAVGGAVNERWAAEAVGVLDQYGDLGRQVPGDGPTALMPTLLAQPNSPALGLARATDRARKGVSSLMARRRRVINDKKSLARSYESELSDLRALKRSRASWRRDRNIRSKKASSQKTAQELSALDAELRVLDAQLELQRKTLLSAVQRELRSSPDQARRTVLNRLSGQVGKVLAPKARRILLPDENLDELADPDELFEQIQLIEQAEKQLRQERIALERREQRYERMALLRQQSDRAGQMSVLDSDQVRRSTSRVGQPARTGGGGGDAAGGASADNEGSPSPPGEPDFDSGDSDDGGGFEQSSIILADVVEPGTADALRRAGRSQSPKARAVAASKAGKEVDLRLQRLKRSRLLIQRHLRKLNAP